MKKSGLLLILIITASEISFSQVVGNLFPTMETRTIDEKKIVLPTDTKNKYTLLGLAYSKNAEEELLTWFMPIYSKFIQKSEGLMLGMGYDVNVYFVPMFTGVNTAGVGKVKKNVLENIDPQLLPHVLFYKGQLKPYKESLSFEKKVTPYFFVLDKEGKIVYATTGVFSQSKMDAIEDSILD